MKGCDGEGTTGTGWELERLALAGWVSGPWWWKQPGGSGLAGRGLGKGWARKSAVEW